jgi:hypothetical protein
MEKFDALQFAAEEADNRRMRLTDVPITDYRPPDEGARLSLCPAGSITLFFARRGEADLVDRIRGAAKSGDDASRLAEEIASLYRGRQRVSYNRAWRLLRRQPFFADVRCGAKTIATNLFLPEDLPLGVISFPHNGGRLPADSLTLVEHLRDDIDEFGAGAQSYDAVALRYPGPLTDAERAALEQVPEDQVELNISAYADCCPDLTGMVILVAMTLVLAQQEEPVASLSAERLSRLSPDATARELMELRREALGHTH